MSSSFCDILKMEDFMTLTELYYNDVKNIIKQNINPENINLDLSNILQKVEIDKIAVSDRVIIATNILKSLNYEQRLNLSKILIYEQVINQRKLLSHWSIITAQSS